MCYACNKGGDLVRGCSCRGPSAGICHLACLLNFAEAQICDKDYFDTLNKCGQCQQNFQGTVRLALARARWLHFADRPETDEWRFQARLDLGMYLDFLRAYDAEAEAVLAECVEAGHRVWGHTVTFTINAERCFAVHLSKKGRPEQERALDILTRIYKLYAESFGPEHNDTLYVLGDLAVTHRRLGNYVKEEELYRKELAAWRRTKGENNMRTMESRYFLVSCLLVQDKFDAARAEYAGLLPLAERVLGPENALVRKLREPALQAALRGRFY